MKKIPGRGGGEYKNKFGHDGLVRAHSSCLHLVFIIPDVS